MGHVGDAMRCVLIVLNSLLLICLLMFRSFSRTLCLSFDETSGKERGDD